jgi:hypothetical protein
MKKNLFSSDECLLLLSLPKYLGPANRKVSLKPPWMMMSLNISAFIGVADKVTQKKLRGQSMSCHVMSCHVMSCPLDEQYVFKNV